MSLVIDLIGQLNCHVTGCKTRKRRLLSAFQSVYCSLQSIVSQIVSSVYCVSVLVSVMTVLMLETIKSSRCTNLTSQQLKSTGIKTGHIKKTLKSSDVKCVCLIFRFYTIR